MTILAGVDIGGTKCGVSLGRMGGGGITLLSSTHFPTPATPDETLQRIVRELRIMNEHESSTMIEAIGVACGGPLDSRKGLILSPPNLPGWNEIDVVRPLRREFGVPVNLQNNANAGALAEWLWGAGRGTRNMIFLTFGTGMGAGLILGGRLYSGTNDQAGEVGHIRLAETGPVGYDKAGSFEGFCSGGGIARQATAQAEGMLRKGPGPLFCPTPAELPSISAETVAQAARSGDPAACEIFERVGESLGRGLAILVDLLNPQRIIIGSIYNWQRSLLEEPALRTLRKEALPGNLAVCEILPTSLGEQLGDLASLSVAYNQVDRDTSQ